MPLARPQQLTLSTTLSAPQPQHSVKSIPIWPRNRPVRLRRPPQQQRHQLRPHPLQQMLPQHPQPLQHHTHQPPQIIIGTPLSPCVLWLACSCLASSSVHSFAVLRDDDVVDGPLHLSMMTRSKDGARASLVLREDRMDEYQAQSSITQARL